MPYNLFSNRITTLVTVAPESGDETTLNDSADAEAQMEEIRKALQAQQAEEDAATEQKFLLHHSPCKSVARTEASTPSPRRHRFDVEPVTAAPDDALLKETEGQTTVLYNEGATDLFKFIEEVDWVRAAEVLKRQPEQASIWVVSTGTVNTTFNWSLWKRLPLHEAARRQAPVEFLTQLIASYPAAVSAVTQFGELPIHLAVECGAAPAVVYLLAVSHWRGCHATDQSGRTPLDILQESDLLLDPVEYKAVVAALQATANTYRGILEEQAIELAQVKAQHALGLDAVRRQHDADLQEEQDQQEKLINQVAALKQQLYTASVLTAQQQTELQQVQQNEHYLRERVEQLLLQTATWKQAYKQEQKTAQELRVQVQNRDNQALTLGDRIADLQTCIQRLAHFHRTAVRSQLETVTHNFEAAVKELSSFATTLNDHEEDLQTLLVEMDRDEEEVDDNVLTTSSPSIRQSEEEDDEDDTIAPKCSDDFDYDASDDDEVAVLRAAQSASDVLR